MDINYYKKYEPIDGKWYFTKELGSGSFGTVFEVERKDFPDMKSAMKIISIPNSQSEVRSYREENYDLDEQSITSYFYGFVEEFVKEFKLMSQLKGNSNIVSYEDHDIKKHEDGIGWDIFIRMELLTPMGQYFSQKRPAVEDIIKLGIDICKALEVCKKYNIIHRDIKPSNIFVSDTGDYKLGDFGVARTLEKTSSGLSKKGTYTYMAPEVFRGGKYGANVDIYSLGIVMYKLLNNNLEPFRTDRTYSDGERAMELRMQGKPLPKPANADGKLAEIVIKACHYNPQERYQNPTQMREDLESFSGISFGVNKENKFDEFTDNSHGTVNIFDSKEQEKNAQNHDSTVSLFDTQNVKKVSEEEIVKLAFSHEPANLNSPKGRAFAERCLSRILPTYDAERKLSDVVKMNNQEAVKALIEKADIDTLLVCFKASAFHISKGDDRQVLGAFQKDILESLKSRDFTTNQSKNNTNSKTKKSIKQPVKTKKEKSFDFSKSLSGAKSRFLKHWKLWMAIVAIIVLAIGTTLAIKNLNFIDNTSGDSAGGSTSAGDMVIEYYPNIELTDGQLQDSADIISQRAKVLGVDYNVKAENGKIVLTIDENFIETAEQKKYVLEMLGADGAMGIASGYSMEIADCKAGFTSVDVTSENKDTFISNFGDKLLTSGLGDSGTRDTLEDLEAEDIYYLHVKLDKETALKFGDVVEATDKQNAESGKVIRELSGMFDFVRHNTLVNGGVQMDWTSAGVIIKVPNADEFYLIPASDAAANSKCLEVLKQVLDTDSMKTGFSYSIIEEPKWEEDEATFGEYQQKEIKGKYIVAKFTLSEYYSQSLNETGYSSVISSIKNRLDTLQIPYAIGYSGLYGKDFSLKISPEHLNSDMIRFFANPASVEFYSQYERVSVSCDKLEVVEDSDGRPCLKVNFLSDKEKLISEFAEKINSSEMSSGTVPTDINNENIYIVINDVTIASAKVQDINEDSTLLFTNLICFEKETLEESDRAFLELLPKIHQESNTSYSWTLDSIKYFENGKFVTDKSSEIPWGYDGSEVEEEIIKVVESHGATVSKSFKARNSLEITVNVEEDNDFANNFMNKVKEIYNSCNFDDCSYASIWFYEEDAGKESPVDAVQFEFSKATYGSMKMQWIVFDGPQYGQYGTAVEKICETDEFYKEKTKRD